MPPTPRLRERRGRENRKNEAGDVEECFEMLSSRVYRILHLVKVPLSLKVTEERVTLLWGCGYW